MNMSIHSAVAKRPKSRHSSFEATLLFVVSCVSVMILIAILFVVQQRGSRKRKVVENAPVWIPPTEFENQKAEKYAKEKNRHHVITFESAKRRRLDPAELKLLEEKLTPNLPRYSRVHVQAKPKRLEPQPSQLHVEAASAGPISSISSSEEINQKGPYGRTPLMVLVRNTMKTEEQIVEELTKLHTAGADLNLCDDSDDTALHMAVSSGRVAVVRKLLQLGASPVIRDRTNSTCLHLAARACAPSMVALLLENEEMREEVDALDDENRTALMLVAMYDMVDTKIAQMLCDAGAKVNYDGDNSLTTWRGRTALHFAAKYNNFRMVAFLLEKNANKDCQDYECCTPLHLAASEDHVEPAKELLKVGASVMLRNDKSQTPYDTALVNNSKDVAALLASGDNLRVQIYSNNGEIFASSSSPGFKCAKVLMARHMRNSRGPLASPRSTQSTPTRCTVASPYNNSGTPHSVAAFGSNYSSPQYPNPIINVVEASLPSPNCHQSTRYTVNAHKPLCGSVAPSVRLQMALLYHLFASKGQAFSTSREKTVSYSPGV
ncbi:ankyrin repeat protein [Ostertagia ostertagi]